MTITTKIALKPFAVPDHAIIELPPQPKQMGIKELPRIPLDQLDPDALDDLAQTWLANLYAQVKRRPPFRAIEKVGPA